MAKGNTTERLTFVLRLVSAEWLTVLPKVVQVSQGHAKVCVGTGWLEVISMLVKASGWYKCILWSV